MCRQVGTRDAPQIWQHELSASLTKLGFQRSVFQPSVFVHRTRNVVVVAHVDDFLCSGHRDDLLWMYDELSKQYEMKKTVRRMIMEPRTSPQQRTRNVVVVTHVGDFGRVRDAEQGEPSHASTSWHKIVQT